ncbi:hypothetical protein [Craterilacuibacter sp. RT1T]|uniref:hypothetical protein n=1 Tax=Craterilacuibacter sp. RT1T TaxID=2942211 RepID=UPI0020BEEE1D|nr:hypothetical protein [Craterilacuibacter sp. RT1T]MCL6262839.1 hypothetical protein [Craterilacuibacter sp. RT1T]
MARISRRPVAVFLPLPMTAHTSRLKLPSRKHAAIGAGCVLLAIAVAALLFSGGQTLPGAQNTPELLAPYTPSSNEDSVSAYTPKPHSNTVTILPRSASVRASQPDLSASDALAVLPDEEVTIVEEASPPETAPADAPAAEPAH